MPVENYQCNDLKIHNEDSSSIDAFEGPEKLLEIWVSPFANLPNGGLRQLTRTEIESILDLINCKILNDIHTTSMDGYLLSESSLFIFNNKIILKTCGTTTTLLCLERLFGLIKNYLNKDYTDFFKIFYSRRSFMFPHKQRSIHQNWNNEVEYLVKYFPKGDSYIVGKSNKDHWHLFVAGDGFKNIPKENIIDKDQTFEILMTNLNPDSAKMFNTTDFKILEKLSIDDGNKIGKLTFEKSKLSKLYPVDNIKHKMLSHEFSFEPCGFSSNSIIDDDSYYTIHITPENGWSYASFETNVNASKIGVTNLEILEKIIDIFKPGSFSFTIFELKDEYLNEDLLENNSNELLMLRNLKLEGYKRLERIIYDVEEYDLLYINFVKEN